MYAVLRQCHKLAPVPLLDLYGTPLNMGCWQRHAPAYPDCCDEPGSSQLCAALL